MSLEPGRLENFPQPSPGAEKITAEWSEPEPDAGIDAPGQAWGRVDAVSLPFALDRMDDSDDVRKFSDFLLPDVTVTLQQYTVHLASRTEIGRASCRERV